MSLLIMGKVVATRKWYDPKVRKKGKTIMTLKLGKKGKTIMTLKLGKNVKQLLP
jgi:hypothetical protein